MYADRRSPHNQVVLTNACCSWETIFCHAYMFICMHICLIIHTLATFICRLSAFNFVFMLICTHTCSYIQCSCLYACIHAHIYNTQCYLYLQAVCIQHLSSCLYACTHAHIHMLVSYICMHTCSYILLSAGCLPSTSW